MGSGGQAAGAMICLQSLQHRTRVLPRGDMRGAAESTTRSTALAPGGLPSHPSCVPSRNLVLQGKVS